MNTHQAKMLKKIEKHGFIDSAILTVKEKSIISFLKKNEFINIKANPNGGPKPAYVISESGKAELFKRKQRNFRFWLPLMLSNIMALAALIISIIALSK